ncbi:MAG TPA: hypothetical protein VFM18_12545 [Methanosarcina sp.]|nr:hypothetical protein [Methanosarcina sp.]
MNISKDLNLVVKTEGDVYFHHSPILYETFKKYHFVICSTFTKLLTAGMQITGAQVAAMTLEETAKEMGKWEGPEGIKDGLIGEIERLTNVICLSDSGWESFPVNIALSRNFVEEEDWEEAKQRIVFFTLICAMTKKEVRNDLLTIMNDSWQTQTTLSGCTDFAVSLQTLKETETSRKKVKQSSVPH